VSAGTGTGRPALPLRTENARQKMPLLFYLPVILWLGMFEVAREELRAPVKIKTRE
jgi:hypothetical protein